MFKRNLKTVSANELTEALARSGITTPEEFAAAWEASLSVPKSNKSRQSFFGSFNFFYFIRNLFR